VERAQKRTWKQRMIPFHCNSLHFDGLVIELLEDGISDWDLKRGIKETIHLR
jgi:hypothetical protein